ncbi:hypothetical protein EK21DRAFT_58564, partial [Setomelanomma holmii]
MNRKRPAEPGSRGNSPPDKRIRPPQRSYSMQDRYANAERQSLASPPPSRKGSGAALPDNVPTGPRQPNRAQKPNPHRSGTNSDAAERSMPNGVARARDDQLARRPSAGHSPLHIMSPGGSVGSGGSTPVHGAPPAPSMLPRAAPSTADQTMTAQQQIQSSDLPMTMAALRNLQLRKLAIANEAKSNAPAALPTDSSLLSAQIKAQQIEITQLKREREDLSTRLKALESLPDQL